MGFEYLIKVRLTYNEKSAIMDLLKQKPSFTGTNTIDSLEYLNFRVESSDPEWADINIAFNEEGIYVCKSLSPELWLNLQDLHMFLKSLNKPIDVEEL